MLERLRAWLDARRAQLPPRGALGQALGSMHANWDALIRDASDGTLEIDNLIAERALRTIAVGRRNWNIVGSDSAGDVSAVIFSLAETCKLNGVNPEAYLRDVVQRIESTLNSDLDSLLHFHWKPRDGSDPVDLNRPILHPNLAAP